MIILVTFCLVILSAQLSNASPFVTPVFLLAPPLLRPFSFLTHLCAQAKVFNENFFRDFRLVLGKEHKIQKLGLCDFDVSGA